MNKEKSDRNARNPETLWPSIVGLGLFIGLTAAVAGCGNFTAVHIARLGDAQNYYDTAAPADSQAMAILMNNCSACHGSGSPGLGGFSVVDNPQAMVNEGFIVPGDPADSLIMQKITASTDSMPPSGKLSQSDIDTLSAWIQTAFNGSTPPTGTQTPGSTPTPIPTPTPTFVPNPTPSPSSTSGTGSGGATVTYSTESSTILVPKCTACHGSGVQSAGYRFDTYSGTMNAVVPGNPSGSTLYQAVSSGVMPLGGPPLTSQELQTISSWISQGALDN